MSDLAVDTATKAELDQLLDGLSAHAGEWVRTPLADKRALLDQVRTRAADVAEAWVASACRAKSIPADSPLAGEEWTSGPYALISYVRALGETLDQLAAGKNPLDGTSVQSRPGGRLGVPVLPFNAVERLVFNGFSAEVWLRPGTTEAAARDAAARRLRDTDQPGEVGLVLGAGNINAIPPLDLLYKLFADNSVALLKLNPINEYLEPYLAHAFAPFVERGFVQIVRGGAEVGAYLTNHKVVETIHITGSGASHDAIVFGPGEEGAHRKADRKPLLDKPITSELGGASPVIVLPGPWTDADLDFQARHIATQRLHNSGHNCIASQILVLPKDWPLAGKLLDRVRVALREAPNRPAYYPGTDRKYASAAEAYPKAEQLGGDPNAPRTLLADLDATKHEQAFDFEYFGPVLGVTSLPGSDAASFLAAAVEFSNDRLYGTLGATILAHPSTVKALGSTLDDSIAELRYGTVGVNAWTGFGFTLARATWGAFPGHDVYDVGSGVDVVHNALLLGDVERTVLRGPFRPFPRSVLSGELALSPLPPWFVGNRTADRTGRHLTAFSAKPSALAMTKLLMAAMRG